MKIAHEMLKKGAGADEIIATIKELTPKTRTYFLVDTLEYLYKGGRIGAAKKLVGSVLQMKPILEISDGQIDAKESQRTQKKALQRFVEIILDECPHKKSAYLNVEHGGNLEAAKELVESLKKGTNTSDIPINFLPPAIILHGGPTILGCSFLVE